MIEAMRMKINSTNSAENPARRITIDSVITVSTEQIWSDLVGEAVILDLKSGVYYGLDAVGAHIWKLLQDAKSIREIRDTVLAEYDVTPHQCESDLLLFLSDLMEKGLIEVKDESGN